jgi:hypothetical protein
MFVPQEDKTDHVKDSYNEELEFVFRWVDNIKMDHREIGWDGMDWIDLALDRDQWQVLVNLLMKFWVP